MPANEEELPGTLKRSANKVQRTYEETLDSAHEQYDSEERAHRTAWSAVKHVAEGRVRRTTLGSSALWQPASAAVMAVPAAASA